VPIAGSEFIVPLDTVIVAIGEEPHLEFLDQLHDVEVSKEGAIVVSQETLATKATGVFAGGDAVTGPKTVLDAMAAGKLAAEMIDRHLRGQQLRREYEVTRPSVYLPAAALTEQELESAERPAAACLPVCQRKAGFAEVELGLSEELAIKEARRCLRCDLETRDAKRALAGN
jgi:NADPH-dependent glutamate synthase beta subunit-like oxidoreductase